MKKITLILLLSLGILVTSCYEEPIENYRRCVVVDKNVQGKPWFKLKKWNGNDGRYNFKVVYVVKYDYDRYNIGDTIK